MSRKRIYEGNASSLTNDAMSACPSELRSGAKISCIFRRKLCDENVAVLSHNEKLPLEEEFIKYGVSALHISVD